MKIIGELQLDRREYAARFLWIHYPNRRDKEF